MARGSPGKSGKDNPLDDGATTGIQRTLMRPWSLKLLLALLAVSSVRANLPQEKVFIVVIDGARYSETFGSRDTYTPVVWNVLRPQGTIYTKMFNDGDTRTCPGHAALLTGRWQVMANDGSQRPSAPTIFEYYRKEKSEPEQSCFVVSGKSKLDVLTYSTDHWFGAKFGASFSDGRESDRETLAEVERIMNSSHPRVMVVNFAETDLVAHTGSWPGYLSALRQADSLVGVLWGRIQSDPHYRGSTTLILTNDHGRHDDQHGGFKSHGDACEGCRHIMLLAAGPGFAPNTIVDDSTLQVDVAPTSAALLDMRMPPVLGKNLLRGSDGVTR